MKADIHPKYNDKTKVACSCGTKFVVGSTVSEIQAEVCSECHPFYTGKGKLVDTAGRVERFRAKKEAAAKSTITGKQARQEKNQKRRDARAERTRKGEVD